MNYRETLDYLKELESVRGSQLGLERVQELMDKLDRPDKKVHSVHVAGTNGKGSCCAMMASVLKSAGYKTGLFTSPHLRVVNERIQINGKPIADEEFADVLSRIRECAKTMQDQPTVFELLTAAAMLYFAQEQCDFAVFEVGMGGRFDATNVLEQPEVEIIMNIGLDHTGILGNTVEQIAFEKAGIIKPGTDVVLYQQSEEVEKVIRKICEERQARLTVTDFSQVEISFDSIEGQTFSYKGNEYAIPLLGEHQAHNAATVIDAAEVLRSRGFSVEQEDLEHGLYAVYWPGRFEICQEDPYFVADGGHNPQCAKTVVSNLARYFPDQKHIMLVGVLADKDYDTMFKILNLASDEYYCITPESERALPAEQLAEHLKQYGKPVKTFDRIDDAVFEAVERAKETDGVVCAVGSLYSLGKIRENIGLY